MSCNERHPLLLECFISFLRCIRMIIGASDSIYKASHCPHHVISTKRKPSNFMQNIRFRHPFSTVSWLMCCNESHHSLFECFITFLRCIRTIIGASGSTYQYPIAQTKSFLPKTNLKCHAEYWILAPFQHRKVNDVL